MTTYCGVCGRGARTDPDGSIWCNRHGEVPPLELPPPRASDAPCCTARADSIGRLPIGYCSPECIRIPNPDHAARWSR